MIGIGIACIMAFAAIPIFSNLFISHRLSSLVDNLYYQLQTARSEAVKRNQNIYVSFNTGTNWCYGINTGSACSCSNPSSCNLGSQTAANDELSLTTNVSNFYFEPTHGAVNQTSTLTFTASADTSKLAQITIARFGSMQICTSNIGGNNPC